MKKFMFTMAMLLVAVMANAKDIKTVVLTTDPIMHCANCETKIKENLKYCKGIKSIETNVANQTVTITYDADKAKPETFIASLKKANYTATEKKCGGCKGEKKACAGEKKSCSGDHKACAGEKKSCEGKSEGCCGKCQEGKSEGSCGKCKEGKEAAGSCCKDKKQVEEKSCCKDKKVDATTGATKKN